MYEKGIQWKPGAIPVAVNLIKLLGFPLPLYFITGRLPSTSKPEDLPVCIAILLSGEKMSWIEEYKLKIDTNTPT